MIIDCFPFFNELDVLEIRLHELADVVDLFVIVEGETTFSGRPKPLFFWENRPRFARFLPKIAHHNAGVLQGSGCWEREAFQRNGITRALATMGLQDDDAVIVSDADEIPSAEAVRQFDPAKGSCSFRLMHSRGALNCVTADTWDAPVAARWAEVRLLPGAQQVRHGLPKTQSITGGWHFSYLGGVAGIRAKVAAFSHQEMNHEGYLGDAHLSLVLSCGLDFQRRDDVEWDFVPLDSRFPRYVLENRHRFRHLWRDACFHEKWIGPAHLRALADSVRARSALQGAVLEFGCWEGRSTVAIATAAFPEKVYAVDHWLGQTGEPTNALAIRAGAGGEEVFAAFRRNVAELTAGNVVVCREDCDTFLDRWGERPVKFAHIDASHDYGSVRRSLERLLPLVVPGGILVGDDFEAAGMSSPGLDGGVERAVRECCPGFGRSGNQWWWVRP